MFAIETTWLTGTGSVGPLSMPCKGFRRGPLNLAAAKRLMLNAVPAAPS
jgi:hypothetical protein